MMKTEQLLGPLIILFVVVLICLQFYANPQVSVKGMGISPLELPIGGVEISLEGFSTVLVTQGDGYTSDYWVLTDGSDYTITAKFGTSELTETLTFRKVHSTEHFYYFIKVTVGMGVVMSIEFDTIPYV